MARSQGGDGYGNRAGRRRGSEPQGQCGRSWAGGRGGGSSPGPAASRGEPWRRPRAEHGPRGSDVHVSSSLAMWIRARFLVLPSIFSSRSKHIFSWLSAAACSSVSFTFSA